jgi:DNA-binding SARP family transcriptional activator
MRVSLLGPVEIADDHVSVRIPGEKLRAIVAALALYPGRTVSRDDLIDELWNEEPPSNAANSLQGHIARLRRILAARTGNKSLRDVVQTTPAGYLLQIPAEQVDALAFTVRVAESEQYVQHAPERALQMLDAALAMWRGPALFDAGQGMICRMTYAHLEETRLIAHERRIDAQLRLGLHQSVTPELEQLHMRYPLREHFCLQLMTALYRSDRQSDAINAYHRTRQRLGRDLGLQPGPLLQRIFRRILSQDLDLYAPPR